MSRGKLRSRFSDAEVYEAVRLSTRADYTVDYNLMAETLSDNSHGTYVSPELSNYWAKQFTETKKNGDHYATLAKPNKALREGRVLREPKPTDFDRLLTPTKGDNSSILVIPDLHAPYHHQDAFAFLKAVSEQFHTTVTVNLGDETDMHALSYHDSDPNLDSAGMELAGARKAMSELAAIFPEMKICHSNHGSMLHRKAKTHGIPAEMIKTYRDVLFPNGGGDGWEWSGIHKLDLPNGGKVVFAHQASGNLIDAAAHERCNLVIGHLHGKFAITYAASHSALYWAVNGGCLIDNKSLAFAYGENFKNKPIVGCTVIYNSLPILIPMQLGDDGRWVGSL